eukprot:CAMPEP_0169371394 /NCGR_PEP_ID=MMETSP1017-20121227/35870_1 /TAXON_ID=342587 /ORGANISM="Karlodinium micrum, Strain CCMP2283" /LENGTH=158 /DNA_ID=CAMNT_0009469881 /DNA_START=121 /DNA_END=594 /DNA_ORIENTATION=+
MSAMSTALVVLFAACADSALLSNNLKLASIGSGAESASEMEKTFLRTEVVHQDSMNQIMKSLTTSKAMQVLQNTSSYELIDLESHEGLVVGKGVAQGHMQHLRRKKQPAGYSGLDGARQLLNDMIYEALLKYDEEIAKCTDYYSKQCALMEVARGEIS